MSKKNFAFISLSIFTVILGLLFFTNTGILHNLKINMSKRGGIKNQTGDYLIVQNLSFLNDFSVPEWIEIDQANSKLGGFIIISQLINEHTDSAIKNAYHLKDIDNNNIYAISVILMDYINNGRFKEMNEFIDTLKDDKNNEYILDLLYAWSKMAQNDKDDAFNILEEFDAQGFEDLYFIHKGMMNEVLGNIDDAIAAYEKALDEKVSLRTVELLARAYVKSNKPLSAKNVVDKYMSIRPESDMGMALKKYIADEKNFKTIAGEKLTYKDGFSEAFFNVGFLNQVQSKPNLSVLFSQIAILTNPNLNFGMLTLANIFADINQKELIIKTLKKVDKKSYLHKAAKGYIAEALFYMEKYDEALKIYKSLIDDKSSNLNHYINIATIYEKQGNLKKALDIYNFIFSQISDNNKKFWVLYFNRGVLHDKMQNWKMAEKDLKRALESMPENPILLNYLGYSWVDKNINIKEGTKMIEKAVVMNPQNESFIDSLGWALYKDKNYPLSVRILEMGKSIDSMHPVINDHLGDVYLALGRIPEAIYTWKKALLYNKTRPELKNPEDVKKKIEQYDKQIF